VPLAPRLISGHGRIGSGLIHRLFVVAVACGLVSGALSGCSSSHKQANVPSTSSTSTSSTTVPAGRSEISFDDNAYTTYGLGAQPTNWNIHSAGADSSRYELSQILDQLWPSAFNVGPNQAPVLNTSLLVSARQTAVAPQTVVYRINPRAVWSDGTPVTYRDFVYNWQAQSGQRAFTDVGGAPFTPAGVSGYADISAVSGEASDPDGVTVTFAHPYADWRSLFAYLMPAEVGQSAGFNTGITDPVADLLSAGPLMVAQAQPGYALVLVRNARYWGTPSNLATVTYYFARQPTETVNALTAGQLDVATVEADSSTVKDLQAVKSLSATVATSDRYEDLDFNEAGGPLADPALRQAISLVTDRVNMVNQTLGQYLTHATPVDNRVFLPGGPSFHDDSGGLRGAEPATATALLQAHGYSLSNSTLTDSGGSRVTLSLVIDAGDPLAPTLAQDIATDCATIGIKVTVLDAGSAADDVLAGVIPPGLPGGWQMALEVRTIPAYPSALDQRYASGGALNVDGVSNPTLDGLVAQADAATGAGRLSLYNQIDALAWTDAVDLPLVQLPVLVVHPTNLLNVTFNPGIAGLAWDEEAWGVKAAA
jgi:peptide/nickel transport system substrate-binding protein